jgi:hypothetical protein
VAPDEPAFVTSCMSLTRLVIASLVVSASSIHAAWLLDLEGGAAFSSKADVQIPNSNLGTPFSMLDDVGGEQAEAFGRVRITWEANDRHVFSVLAAPLAFDYAGSLQRDVSFAGEDFAAGTDVTGRYRFNSYRFTWRYNLVKRENLTFGLGLTAKVRDAGIELRGGGLSAVDENVGLVPLAHLWLDWKMAPKWHLLFNADAAASGQGRAEDVALAVQYDVSDAVAMRLGYRLLEGGADSDDVETFSLFHYATVGMTFRF